MKKVILLTVLLFTLLSANSLHPGTHYNIFMKLFHNQYYVESALVGSGMIQQYPEFFKMPDIKLYTAVSFYKTGHSDNALELLRDVKENDHMHNASINAELLLHLLAADSKSGKFTEDNQLEFPLFWNMISGLSLSTENINRTFEMDANKFLKGKTGIPTCDSLKAELLKSGSIAFKKEEIPYVMCLIRHGINQHMSDTKTTVDIGLFVTLLLIEQESERVAIPYVEEVEITKKMKRKSEDDSKISEEIEALYKIIY